MNQDEGLRLFDKMVIAVVVAVIALFIWNLALRPVAAAGATELQADEPICYRYRGQIVTVACFRKLCLGWAEAHVTTFTTVTRWMTGPALYRGKPVWIELCR